MKETEVAITSHGYSVGDKVVFYRTRWTRLRCLLTKPRVHVVDWCSANAFATTERRMTWREWLSALLRVFR